MVRYLNSRDLFNAGYWMLVYSPYGQTFKRHEDEVTILGDFTPPSVDVLIDGENFKAYDLSGYPESVLCK